jgi:hypothetical protein
LCPFTLDSDEPSDRILRELYVDRIQRSEDDPKTIRFHKRINCLGLDSNAIVVSLAGPGSCFSSRVDGIHLTPELLDDSGDPAYTSYLIPSRDRDPISAGECTIFKVSAKLHQQTYERLVADRFSVDSYTRLKRDIETQDLEYAGQEAKNFYNEYIKPQGAIVAPEAYDIVIFQTLGHRVEVRSESIRITPGRPPSAHLSNQVLWFFGQPEEFFLNLSYAEVDCLSPVPVGAPE